MNAPIGLIGLGAMGRGMAKSLRRAGYRVHVCDARPGAARPSSPRAASRVPHPADLARTAT